MPTRQPDGGTVWNGLMKDATDQVAALAALRESEARYRLLTDNATDLIARLTPGAVFVYASPAARALFDTPPEDFFGRHVRELVHRMTCGSSWRRSTAWRPTGRPTPSPTAFGRPTDRTSGASPPPGPSATRPAGWPRS